MLTSKPNFEKRTTEITCGRVTLPLPDLTDINNNTQSSLVNAEAQKKDFFVYTKASLKLLEQVARSIECNEPVLLCGETGVGKTSSLQHLAKLLGKKMNVINLSQQTETGDLLGSYKPVDIKSQMKIVKEKFLVLFVKSFNEHENETFLNHIQVFKIDSNGIIGNDGPGLIKPFWSNMPNCTRFAIINGLISPPYFCLGF